MWIEREISVRVLKAAKTFPAMLLTGARQVGKTSLLQRLFPNHSFISLDLPSNAELAEKKPDEFLRQNPPPVIIDEVQYAPQLFRSLKIYIDSERKRYGQFILTGSQKFTLMKGVTESLAGRCAVIELETLSYSEISSVSSLSPIEVALRGGFPELNSRPELDRQTFYRSYIVTYLERDVRSLLKVGQLRDFERFLRACALRSGQMLNKSEIARDVGISPVTANEWLSVLQASNQAILLEPWFSNKVKSLSKAPKLYLSDTGLLCFLLGINTFGDLLASPLAGAVWETFVFAEVRKKQLLKSGSWDIWCWRDNRGIEVDFLIHRGGRFSLFEAKLSAHAGLKDISKMLKVADILGRENIMNMSVVTMNRDSYPISEDAIAIPVNQLFEYI